MAIYYIYENQNNLRIRLSGCGSLAGAETAEICYGTIDSDGDTTYVGKWTATIEDATTGIIYADLESDDSLNAGDYAFWAKITFSDDRVSVSKAVKQTVRSEGETI